ncbi:MAG: aldo/keto reductase [Pseudoxanthomonas suwonensis]|nr:aldo/keto reductase [Pseudoxanthomonas suwonensis]
MITRRTCLKAALAAGVTLALDPKLAFANADAPLPLITRKVPGSGEELPVIGLGSSATFSRLAGGEEHGALADVLRTLIEGGGRIFDTAPSYGASEQVAGRLLQELGLAERTFWATKLNVAGRGGGKADEAAARQQLATSFQRIGKSPIDLINVHNMGDPDTQLGLLRELKTDGRIRYLGITTTFDNQYEHLERVMKTQALDFIGVDYAIDNRTMEQRIFPLAADKGIGVLAYAPFGRTRLWQTVRGHELPDWAAEFDAATWGQFFLKWVIANPVVTATTPATSQAKHMLDNLGAGRGRLPDAAMRARMRAWVEALPS